MDRRNESLSLRHSKTAYVKKVLRCLFVARDAKMRSFISAFVSCWWFAKGRLSDPDVSAVESHVSGFSFVAWLQGKFLSPARWLT